MSIPSIGLLVPEVVPCVTIVCVPKPITIREKIWTHLLEGEDNETALALDEMDGCVNQMAVRQKVPSDVSIYDIVKENNISDKEIRRYISTAKTYCVTLERIYQTVSIHPHIKCTKLPFFQWSPMTYRTPTGYSVSVCCNHILGDLVMATYRVGALYLLLASIYFSKTVNTNLSENVKRKYLENACHELEFAGSSFISASIIIDRWYTFRKCGVPTQEQDFLPGTAHSIARLCSSFRDLITIKLIEMDDPVPQPQLYELVAIEHNLLFQKFDFALFDKRSVCRQLKTCYAYLHLAAVAIVVKRKLAESDPAMAICLLDFVVRCFTANIFHESHKTIVMLKEAIQNIRSDYRLVLASSEFPSEEAMKACMPVPYERALPIPYQLYFNSKCDMLNYQKRGEPPAFEPFHFR